jgi:hypothetical protein
MLLRIKLDSLKETTPREYLSRFLTGGAITLAASLIAMKWGPVIGGLFLAFPGIFFSSASLVEKHKQEREQREGKQGIRAARAEASVEATGASEGALGLAAFAIVVWKFLPAHSLLATLALALPAWALVSISAWWLRERIRLPHRAQQGGIS